MVISRHKLAVLHLALRVTSAKKSAYVGEDNRTLGVAFCVSGGNRNLHGFSGNDSFFNLLAEHIIGKLKDKTRKVYFDVDGVLRDVIGYFGVPDDDWDVKVNGKTIFQEIGDDFACLMSATILAPHTRKPNSHIYCASVFRR